MNRLTRRSPKRTWPLWASQSIAVWALVALILVVSAEQRVAILHTSSPGRASIHPATPQGDPILIRLLALDDTAHTTLPDLMSVPLRSFGTLALSDSQRPTSRSTDQPSLRAPPRAVSA